MRPARQDYEAELHDHFAFGENWSSYAKTIAPANIEAAQDGLVRLLGDEGLAGKRMIDIGCGSGVHAVAAHRLRAAEILSVDIDPVSVDTTRQLLQAYAPDGRHMVRQVSVFDLRPEDVGTFDIVYSWGVLHHTGDMGRAIGAAARLVAPRGLLVLALYRRTLLCPLWRLEKRWYSKAYPGSQALARTAYVSLIRLAFLVQGRDFRRHVADYQRNRGMSFSHDVHDWLGGYPYESISAQAIEAMLGQLGFDHLRSFVRHRSLGLLGSGCNEYVYRRRDDLAGGAAERSAQAAS